MENNKLFFFSLQILFPNYRYFNSSNFFVHCKPTLKFLYRSILFFFTLIFLKCMHKKIKLRFSQVKYFHFQKGMHHKHCSCVVLAVSLYVFSIWSYYEVSRTCNIVMAGKLRNGDDVIAIRTKVGLLKSGDDNLTIRSRVQQLYFIELYSVRGHSSIQLSACCTCQLYRTL